MAKKKKKSEKAKKGCSAGVAALGLNQKNENSGW
jgi:hypothetical protein